VHQLVILVSDLYLSQETCEQELPAGIALPGLQHVARFGARSRIADGWRSWLARWLTGQDVGPPAAIAAVTLQVAATAPPATRKASAPPAATPTRLPVPISSQLSSAWLATPMHLVAGLTSVHVDRRSILRLDADDQSRFAADFQSVFGDSGFELRPLDSGDFLVLGPQIPPAEMSEPARSMGASMADAQGAQLVDPTLRRLGTEIEMWLHDHPVNAARSRRGEWPVTGLWLWGGGPVNRAGSTNRNAPTRGGGPTNGGEPANGGRPTNPGEPANGGDRASGGPTMRGGRPNSGDHATGGDSGHAGARGASDERAPNGRAGAPLTDIAFGRDAYLQGLWAMHGEKVFPLPQQLADVFGYPQARRAVLVIEIGSMLHSNPTWTFFDAVAQIDRSFIAPAVAALSRGQCERLVILANDHQLTLRARDRLKFWRRIPPGLSGLQ
jgi:hypothetical protein